MPPASIPSSEISSPEIPDSSFSSTEGSGALASLALDFSRRAQLVEMMEQPCSYEELRACLRDIARVDRLTFAHRPTLSWLDELIASAPKLERPLRVVDVGCGDGDMLRRIDAWGAKRGVSVALTGIDLNPNAIRAAKEATPWGQRIEWIVGDALADAAGEVDVVVSSLLTHHLTDTQVVQFIRWMESSAVRGWFINDLHRQPVAYHLFRLWTHFTNWHPFVKNDGPVSIRRSFVMDDWQRLFASAGLAPQFVTIREYRPARLCVGRIK